MIDTGLAYDGAAAIPQKVAGKLSQSFGAAGDKTDE
jgi:hypothetical protein